MRSTKSVAVLIPIACAALPVPSVWTASIVKLEILEALLHKRNGQLSSYEKSQAKTMIENSDNDAAQELWERIGYGPALDAFSKLVGLTDTKSDPRRRWGRPPPAPGTRSS